LNSAPLRAVSAIAFLLESFKRLFSVSHRRLWRATRAEGVKGVCLWPPTRKEATPGKGVASSMNYFWLIARFSGAALGVAASVAGASIGSILTVVKIRFSRLNTCWRSTCGMSASASRVV